MLKHRWDISDRAWVRSVSVEHTRIVAWRAQMRLVHRRIAEVLVIARESIESGGPSESAFDRLNEPLTYCLAFCIALDGHHAGEDGSLFPRLVEQRPELADVIGKLSQDHRMIGHLLAELRHSMASGEPPEAVLHHLDGIEAVITSHFRYEEKRLLGVLDDLDLGGLEPTQAFGPLG